MGYPRYAAQGTEQQLQLHSAIQTLIVPAEHGLCFAMLVKDAAVWAHAGLTEVLSTSLAQALGQRQGRGCVVGHLYN